MKKGSLLARTCAYNHVTPGCEGKSPLGGDLKNVDAGRRPKVQSASGNEIRKPSHKIRDFGQTALDRVEENSKNALKAEKNNERERVESMRSKRRKGLEKNWWFCVEENSSQERVN